jgi:hypothetical protein
VAKAGQGTSLQCDQQVVTEVQALQ